MSKKEVFACLLAMVAIIGLSASSIYYKVELDKSQDVVDRMRLNFPNAVRTTSQIGFFSGCMMATVQMRGMTEQDPLFPFLQQLCAQSGKDFADHINITVQKDEK